MRQSPLFVMLLVSVCTKAQFGPGGVGTSSSNVLWLSADKGVSVSGGVVNTWSDRSGNGNHAAYPAGVTSARPSYVTNSLNGLPSLDFDGSDDQLRVPDDASLDLSQWDIFMVGAADLLKNNNAWLCKGNYLTPNYAMETTASGQFHLPILDIFGLLSAPFTAGGQMTTGFGVFEYSNTLSLLTLSYGRSTYSGGGNVFTDLGLNLPLSNNAALYIGGAQGTTAYALNGDIAELIMFNAPQNPVRRLVVNNYLAAKYGLALSTDDLYQQDEETNGNYDFDVAGIGRSNGHVQLDSQGSGVVRVANASSMTNDEFLLWGRDNGAPGPWDVTDFPTGTQGRWERVWRVNEVHSDHTSTDVGSIDMTFDLNGLGPVVPSDLRLLVDSDNDAAFADETPLSGATSLGGGLYKFTGVTAITNDRRFTLATANLLNTPLPIELISFQAHDLQAQGALLAWTTASEQNNDHFTLERSADVTTWTRLVELPGAMNSTAILSYSWLDHDPLEGISYYRLGQTDVDGNTRWSPVVMLRRSLESTPVLYPNPASDMVTVRCADCDGTIQLVASDGRSTTTHARFNEGVATFDVNGLAAGIYSARFGDDLAMRSMPVVVIGH